MDRTEARADAATVMRVVPSMYATRALAFAAACVVIGVHLHETGAPASAFVLLALQFLAYPALVWLQLRRSANPHRTAHAHLYADSFFLGAWVAGLGFPGWIGYCLAVTTLLNATIVRGPRGSLVSAAWLGAGMAAAVLALGLRHAPGTSALVTGLSMLVGLVYLVAVGLVAFRRTASLVEARRAQRESEDRYRLIAENAGDLVLMVDDTCRLLYASPSCRAVLGEAATARGADPFQGVAGDEWLATWTRVRNVQRTGDADAFDVHLAGRDGGHVLECTCHPARDASGRVSGTVIAARDVTALRRHEEVSKVASRAFERMTEAMLITDAAGRITLVNDAYCAVTGYRAEEVVGRNEREFRAAMQPESFYGEIYDTVERTGKWAGATWTQRRDGTVYREWRSVSAVRDEAGAVTHYVSLFFEIGPPGSAARAA